MFSAAGCSLSNVFTSPFQERLKIYTNKLVWADGNCSDLIAYLHVYKVWTKFRKTNVFKNHQAEKLWARKNYLSLRALKEWNHLITEIRQRLERLGIKDPESPTVTISKDARYTILKIVMCGAFYPNYFKHTISEGGIENEKEAVKVLGGRDPFRTVYLKNMDLGHPVSLYAKRIKDMFDTPAEDIKISSDNSQ